MTPYMRGPALACDAGGPVMVVSGYRLRAALRSGGEIRGAVDTEWGSAQKVHTRWL